MFSFFEPHIKTELILVGKVAWKAPFWNGNSPKHHQCTFSFALQAALLPFTIGYWPNTTIGSLRLGKLP